MWTFTFSVMSPHSIMRPRSALLRHLAARQPSTEPKLRHLTRVWSDHHSGQWKLAGCPRADCSAMQALRHAPAHPPGARLWRGESLLLVLGAAARPVEVTGNWRGWHHFHHQSCGSDMHDIDHGWANCGPYYNLGWPPENSQTLSRVLKYYSYNVAIFFHIGFFFFSFFFKNSSQII